VLALGVPNKNNLFMTNFILEIFSEEIPALMQKTAAENFVKIASEIFTKNNFTLEASQLKSFISPRRLTLQITGLNPSQKLPEVKKVGPKISADEKAIAGFLRANGLKDVSELQQVDNAGNLCYCYVKPASEIKTAEVIKNSLPQILQKMTAAWPKLMRFDADIKWIRPVRNIFCMLGNEVVSFEFFGLTSNDLTFAHNGEALKIKDANDYEKILEENFVIVDRLSRKEKIITQIKKIENDLALKTIDEAEKSALFDEVTGLCEWPAAAVGSIDQKFLKLPEEVLVLTLKLNQKYFCLRNADDTLSAKFIFISNVKVTPKIIADNEKLVRARLSDAEFFISEDLKKPLESRLEALKKIIFHQKLGSVYEKTQRLNRLGKMIAVFVPHCDLGLVEKAANLCKADLPTKMVAELPELQGKIGSFYAHAQKENNKIAAAIYEHYLPLGAASELPQTPLGTALSIADKIDSIVGFFLVDEKPTASKDPYALRRAALGVIRIILKYDLTFSLRVLCEKAFNNYPKKLLKNSDKKAEEIKKELVEEIIKFFIERLKTYLKDNEKLNAEIVNVVLDEIVANLGNNRNTTIFFATKKIRFLDKFIADKANEKILQLYKRSANILAIEEKKDGKKYGGKPSRLAMKNKYEVVLQRHIKQVAASFPKLVIKGEFVKAFKLLHSLELPLSHFFDNITVNDENKNLRENRLILLSQIRDLFNSVADLSKVSVVS
jgi:glycyl-tRNA synthetase beta chain